ncbi:MAG: hypothetical protein K2Q23_15485 [Bryobacteraceae bacterium]|nr:hypothetical protein [Bryobacteraceae bacterium]
MARQKTLWGTVQNTGAGSMDLVILTYPVGNEFTEGELDADIRARQLKTRGAMECHLNTLRTRGYVRKGGNVRGWVRVK